MELLFFTNPWMNALAILGIFVGVSIILQVIIELGILRITRRTATTIDDDLVHAVRYPLFFILVLFGIKATVNLQEELISNWVVNNALDTAIVVLVIFTIVRIINILLEGWGKKWAEKTKSKVDDIVLHFLRKAVYLVVWIIGFLFILGLWGIEIGPLIASLGIAGLAVALALQGTLSNIFGGISMILDKNISIGDVIDVDGAGVQRGTVVDIGLRSTKIKTYDNEMLVVPNGQLANNTIINLAQPTPKARVSVPFSVAYGSDIEKVKKVVLKLVDSIPDVEKEPEPSVRFLEMADSSLNFKLFFYVSDYSKKFASLDLANTLIYNALNKNKIEIPFPQMDVHLKRR